MIGCSNISPSQTNVIDITLLDQCYAKYGPCPQQFLLQIIPFSSLWPSTSQAIVRQLLIKIGKIYNPIPYHNLTHAFDVTTTLKQFLKSNLAGKIQENDTYYMLLAAYAHDAGHQGFTNQFYRNTKHSLFLKYSESTLENMHAAHLMHSLRECSIDVPQDKKEFMVRLILHTDNYYHSKIMKQIEQNGVQPYIGQILLHMADLAPATKHTHIAVKWNQLLYAEFSKEKEEINSRHVNQDFYSFSQKQIFSGNIIFFNNMVIPLYQIVSQKDSFFLRWFNQLLENVVYWNRRIQELDNN